MKFLPASFFYLFVLVTISSCRNETIIPEKEIPTVTLAELFQQPYQKPYELSESQKYLYDSEAVPEVSLEVTKEEWNKILSYYDQNQHNEEYIVGKFSFNKNGSPEKLDSIGIWLRGNTSRRRPEGVTGQSHNSTNPDWHHASFTVNFKKYRKTQKFQDSEKVI